MAASDHGERPQGVVSVAVTIIFQVRKGYPRVTQSLRCQGLGSEILRRLEAIAAVCGCADAMIETQGRLGATYFGSDFLDK